MMQVSDYWKCSLKDLYEQYEMKDYDELFEYAKENIDNIWDLWNNEELEDHTILRKVIKYAKSVLEYFGEAFLNQPELNVLFELGQLLGTIDSIDKMSLKYLLEREAEWTYVQELKKVKHLDNIIKALKMNGAMNQTELCEYLNLSESLVSQIIKKAEPMKLMIFSKIGKYKYLRLTDYGRRVAGKIENDNTRKISMEKMLTYLVQEFQFEEQIDLKLFEEYIRRYNGKQKDDLNVDRETGLLIQYKKLDGRCDKINMIVEGYLHDIHNKNEYYIFGKEKEYINNSINENNCIRRVI